MNKIKEPVRLRRRTTKDGSQSLYLDIYLDGKRSYEYLHLYLLPERTRGDKDRNRETLAFAETLRAKRVVELRNGEYGFKNKGKSVRFFAYYEEVSKGYSGTTRGNWEGCLLHLRHYEKRDITIADITERWVRGFREYLASTKLSVNTQSVYFSKLNACLHRAVKDGIIDRSPMENVEGIRMEEVERSYLTLDELRLLTATPLKNDNVRRAFLFSCLTGMRYSDIKKLSWGDVKEQEGYTRIVFSQKKTHGLVYLDVNQQAVALMGKRGNGLVFKLPLVLNCNKTIRKWTAQAGIDKDITFHCARHTFAIMMLDIGTDIYTVSKLLGHRNLSTTQVYAKVLDKNRRAAVEKIPSIL